MKKRLRKKKHLKEFQELVCKVSIKLKPLTDFDTFLDDFIENGIEGNGLYFGGSGKDLELDGFVELGRRQVFKQKQDLVSEWLKNHKDIESFSLKEPVDAWYGDFD